MIREAVLCQDQKTGELLTISDYIVVDDDD
jgi:hypothetical protein